jgi:hypothetical protein
MLTRLRPLWLCLFAGACSAGSLTAIDLTMTFDSSVSADALAQVKTFAISTSGDDTDSYTTTLDRPAMRTERQTYLPASSARSIGFSVDAYAADGTGLAHGTSAVTPIQLGKSSSVSISLSSGAPMGDLPSALDLPEPIVDLQRLDAGSPNYAGSYSLATAAQGQTLLVPRPSTTSSGALMLAMIVARDTTDTNVISIAGPAGWTQLTTSPSNTPTSALAAWFWKIANASEPSSYLFTRTNDWAALGQITSYNYVNPSSPFDATLVGQNAAPGPAMIGAIHTNTDFELVAVNVVCPDDFNVIFMPPGGITSRNSVGALSADYGTSSHGDQNPLTIPSSSSTCRYLWMTTGIVPQ